MERRQSVESVVRALRRVNFQGSIFGQTVAIRLGLSESDIDALELLHRHGRRDRRQARRGHGPDDRARSPASSTASSRPATSAASPTRPTAGGSSSRSSPRRSTTLESMMALARARRRGRGRPVLPRAARRSISDFLTRMADAHPDRGGRACGRPPRIPTVAERAGRARRPARRPDEARLTFRSGAQDLRLRAGRVPAELYRGRFDGRDAAGPRPRRPRARPVPRASRSTGGKRTATMRSTRRSPGRSRSSAGSTGSRPTCARSTCGGSS